MRPQTPVSEELEEVHVGVAPNVLGYPEIRTTYRKEDRSPTPNPRMEYRRTVLARTLEKRGIPRSDGTTRGS
jgi:hypothetical protein